MADGTLQERAEETRRLLRTQKRRVAERLVSGGEAAAGELGAITKMELAAGTARIARWS